MSDNQKLDLIFLGTRNYETKKDIEKFVGRKEDGREEINQRRKKTKKREGGSVLRTYSSSEFGFALE